MKTPLRWHGDLRDEPTHLPWGYGYEVKISGVESEGALRAARGGLRLSFTTHPEGGPPPDVDAGDQVAVLTEANLPQVFRDEGAFDRRAYLAQQNIDLVAALRAPQLMERIGSPRATARTAHWDGADGDFLWPETAPGRSRDFGKEQRLAGVALALR